MDGLIEGRCDERRDREADWALCRDSLARLPPDRRQDVIVGGQEGTRDAEQSKGVIVPKPVSNTNETTAVCGNDRRGRIANVEDGSTVVGVLSRCCGERSDDEIGGGRKSAEGS